MQACCHGSVADQICSSAAGFASACAMSCTSPQRVHPFRCFTTGLFTGISVSPAEEAGGLSTAKNPNNDQKTRLAGWSDSAFVQDGRMVVIKLNKPSY